MESAFSRGYTAGIAAMTSGLGAVALLATGERPAGVGGVEPLGLLLAAALFAAAGVADRTTPATPLPRLLAVAGLVLVLVLCFLALGDSGVASIVFFELAAAVCGALYLAQAGRALPGS